MNSVKPRWRVLHGEIIALGPGKMALLEEIGRAGTLAEAARHLGMSYTRAWQLVQTMNACFKDPLVAMGRGGTSRGHAGLTDAGRRVLALYRRMERESLAAAEPAWVELRALLGD